MEWRESEIGLAIGQEIYVNFQNMDLVETKKKELNAQLIRKMPGTAKASEVRPSVFLSYCWYNSHDAVSNGTPALAGALGWKNGDPRVIKEALTRAGHNVWLDIEQAGKQGLFEDIANGIRHSSVVVVCISREYAASPNCMMELRFAIINLRKPVIGLIVGTSDDWMQTEAGMLLVNRAKATVIDFRDQNEISVSKLCEATASHVKKGVCAQGDGSASSSMDSMQCIEELSELVQRRHLRQTLTYSNEDGLSLPTLLVLDTNCVVSSTQEMGNAFLTNPWRILFLCEQEGNWHISDSHPLKLPDQSARNSLLKKIAPYLVRIYSVLESSEIELNCLQDNASKVLCAYLYSMYQSTSRMDGTDTADDIDLFRKAFLEFRSFIYEYPDLVHDLRPCILPSRRKHWLCATHRTRPNITEVSKVALNETSSSKVVVSELDLMLRQELIKLEESRQAKQETRLSIVKPNFQTVSSIVGGLQRQEKTVKAKSPKSKFCNIS